MDETPRVIADRYRLIHPIAEGGFGRVWKAHDEVLRADVVVKEVLLPFTADPDEQARRLMYAKREARNAARLRHHPGIVPVYDVVTDDARPWIVMELIDGSSLEERLNTEGTLSVAKTAKLAGILLKALGAAHTAKVIHRDVKPANVMLAADGRILLTDFGIATYQVDTRLTTDGSVIGSLEYIAPERLHGVSGTPASDLFSLGVTLYRAVEGVSPFLRDSPAATLAAVANDDPPPPRQARRLTALLQALLAKEPDTRATVAEALVLLRAPRTSKSNPPKPKPPKPNLPKKAGEKKPPEKSVTETALRAPDAFEQKWTGDEDPEEFSEYHAPWGEGFICYGLGLLLLGFAAASQSNGVLSGFLLALALAMCGTPSLDEWRHCRGVRKGMSPRVLRINQDGITTSDHFGDQHIPWTEIEQISVRHTDSHVRDHSLLALHVQLHMPKPGDPPLVLYRSAGQHIEADPTDPNQRKGVPVCVLGPIPGPRRVALKNAVSAFTKHSLQTELNW